MSCPHLNKAKRMTPPYIVYCEDCGKELGVAAGDLGELLEKLRKEIGK